MIRKWLFLVGAISCFAIHPFSHSADFALQERTLSLPQVDLDHALQRDTLGYPRLDASKLNRESPTIVTRSHRAVVLENRWLRVIVLPELGRIYSLVSKITGHEQLWTNAIAKPLAGQVNDLGWWMIWGGVEYTLPRGEHGTTWALPWKSEIIENSETRKAIRMSVIEPATQLTESIEVSIRPDSLLLETKIVITNQNTRPVQFAHWINPMWAPGGRGEVTPKTELIVPCTAMRIADKPFNQWMRGYHEPDFRRSPLRWVSNWRDIGDLLVEELTAGFYSAFCHESNEGIVRVFDPKITPGMDIWTWGYPPPPGRQREYSLKPNLGYVEMWGGTARDFSDGALRTLGAGERLQWTEWMFAYSGTSGLTYANSTAAVSFVAHPSKNEIEMKIFPATARSGCLISARAGEQVLLRMREDLTPGKLIQKQIEWRKPLPQVAPLLRIEMAGEKNPLIETKAELK